MSEEVTVYDYVGGDEKFALLVDAFYRGIESDPLLRPMYPEDLAGAKERMFLFLIQYWGGPRHYEAQRGHPRLRMRHFPFSIGPAERDAWLRHMLPAIDEAGIPEPARSAMIEYFEKVAHFMMNRTEVEG